MVRIPKAEYGNPMRTLECGAQGIMVPPLPHRAGGPAVGPMEPVSPSRRAWFDNVGADGEFGLSNPAQYFERSNRETFVVLQIEDRDAVDHVEENAAVEGVTVLFVGPADLSMSLGVPLQFDHPTMQSAIDRVARAAAKAGIWWGTTTSSPAFAQQALDRGARMVTCANDHFLLLDGLRDAYRQFSEISIG